MKNWTLAWIEIQRLVGGLDGVLDKENSFYLTLQTPHKNERVPGKNQGEYRRVPDGPQAWVARVGCHCYPALPDGHGDSPEAAIGALISALRVMLEAKVSKQRADLDRATSSLVRPLSVVEGGKAK